MGRAVMIGGIFLLSRNPQTLAAWYRQHLGWDLTYLPDEGAYYVELYFRELDQPDRRQHLVYAIMPGDPGPAGLGHIVNYRVDDVASIVASLRRAGVETTEVTEGPDAEGRGRFARLEDPEGHQIELWQHIGP